MGMRGAGEVVAVLPPSVAESASAVLAGLEELAGVRHAALSAAEVCALAELFERLAARVGAGRLAVLAGLDARDDVYAKGRPGQAGCTFAQLALGQRRGAAKRDCAWAGLLRRDGGDLASVGAVFAAGEVSTAHVEVAVRTHARLGAAVRDAVVHHEGAGAGDVDGGVVDGDVDGGIEGDQTPPELAAALAALHEGSGAAGGGPVRRIAEVDVVLAFYARRLSVPEFAAVAERIVATLAPPTPSRAHEKRFLTMSPLPGGGWAGTFECGDAQGLFLKRAIAAGSAPRHGKAIDADGAEHDLPDSRPLVTRQMDTLTDLVALGLANAGIVLPPGPGPGPAPRAAGGDEVGNDEAGAAGEAGRAGEDEEGDAGGAGEDEGEAAVPDWLAPAGVQDLDDPGGEPDDDAGNEPPVSEGELVVIRPPGQLTGPFPKVDLVLVAGIEHAATAWAHAWRTGPGRDDHDTLPIHPEDVARQWLRRRFGDPPKPPEEPQPQDPFTMEGPPDGLPPDGLPPDGLPPDEFEQHQDAVRPREGHWLNQVLSPYTAPARLEHAGPVDATTFGLLTCSATVRAALLTPGGALLDLGRSQRLASPAQKTALLARDGGCVIPGCTVPGDACDAHHVHWWSRGGLTDLDNLALACSRHHDEIHQGHWHLQIIDGVPWARPPRWINRTQPLLRNATHHPHSQPRPEEHQEHEEWQP